MQIVDRLCPVGEPVSVALGTFDGVHRGHQALLKACTAGPEAAMALTFREHPARVLCPQKAPGMLSTAAERAAQMEAAGIAYLAELPFTRELAAMPAEAFLRTLCESLTVRRIVVGYNYTFGAGGAGSAETLRTLAPELGYEAVVIPPVLWDGAPISSSRIREKLAEGDAAAAEAMLGRAYALGGPIVRGKQLGRTIGFPTVNLDYPEEKMVPAAGVYAGILSWNGGSAPAVGNVGTNPTVETGTKLKLEVHALAGIPLTYGDTASFAFTHRIRGEQRFASVDELVKQMTHDRETAITLLNH